MMIELKNKYVIGTHVMFYEVEMISEFVQSIYDATGGIENPDNIRNYHLKCVMQLMISLK